MSTPDWQKPSSNAEANGGVHITTAADGSILIQESDDPDTIVTTTPEKLRAFILGVKAGEFDHFAEGEGEGER
ncbi:DUF397 domain-containing protein [Streptomyces sp. SID1121]|uniref:DUF397 domain-containing protein n=1 Tax=Streptomyces sp. SID1121 TaxID=3425888 RepID=UPI0040566FEE